MVNFVPLITKFIMQKSIRLVSGLYLKLSLLTVAVGLVLRVVLLFNEQTTSPPSHSANGAKSSCWAP